MSESEVKIVIRAVDETSATLKSVENNTLSAMDAFQKQTNTLISLGNAASSVDNIFDSYQNLQGRLENAAIRVEEAQKNQRDAQYKLNKVVADGTSTAEDIAHAQDDLATASNRVTIAQNNQERANNQVIGTYINMGVQMVTLVGSLPKLITGVISMTASAWASIPAIYAQAAGFLAITIAGAHLWAILLAIIAAVTAAVVLWKLFHKTATETADATVKETTPAVQQETVAIQQQTTAVKEATEAVKAWDSAQMAMAIRNSKGAKGKINDAGGLAAALAGGAQAAAYYSSKGAGGGTAGMSNVPLRNDFVMRPGQPAVPFSSQDTLVGMKDMKGLGGGVTVNIGNVYGVNAQDIAKELQRELRNTVRA